MLEGKDIKKCHCWSLKYKFGTCHVPVWYIHCEKSEFPAGDEIRWLKAISQLV